MVEDEIGPAAEKRKRELKGDIDYQFIQFDDLPRTFREGVEGLYAQPIIIIAGGLTTDNKPGPLVVDSNNRLEVMSSPAVGSGGLQLVAGTYTKGATGTVGELVIVPASTGDLSLIHGYAFSGGTKVGAGDFTIGFSSSSAAGGTIIPVMASTGTTISTSEQVNFPGIGEASTDQAKLIDVGADLGRIVHHAFSIKLSVMASAEVFSVVVRFWSKTNTAPTTVEGTSDSFA